MKKTIPSVIIMLTLISAVFISVYPEVATAQADTEKIAFIRNGDIWIMNTDGSNQTPLVGGIQNAKGKISWEPGNKRLAFSRAGMLTLKYPDGGGGSHAVYDLFHAFLDSTNNFWMGFTETLGAQSPEYSADGSMVVFSYDLQANTANAMWPDYRIGFYDTKTRVVSDLRLPRGADDVLFGSAPTLSPDKSKIAFNLSKFDSRQVKPVGIVITSSAEITESAEDLLTRAKELSNSSSPSWSPDGKWIAYISTDMSNQAVLVVRPDLSEKKVIWKATGGLTLHGSPPSWSPDSKKLAFSTSNGAIYTVNLDGTDAKMISGPGSDTNPAWSR